ncbi:MAG: ATP-binding cassette domain-containing protein [Actinomyces sp.]|uniref:iron ABC transporter ATP-binding protein n=1 Tax=Actinomyces sp. TaxID=29317 RepID=UPI0026DCBCC4|nr:ATP-binding cassette domain-containing protein [Actinomyces sp.]MDO4242902.1 ATP-binding cassette domain-containing protein [Actinomyces sp.]
MIELSAVTKVYSPEVVIGPVDLVIPEGGITALVGPNGAGKSTLLMMIGRLLGIDEGAIRVAGLDVSRTRSADLARVVSILRQDNHVVTRLTVRQLVGLGRFPYSRGRLRAGDEEVVSRCIDFLGLEELEHRYLDQLSGGQRQRAYVAMVLCQETDYVLLDEPLNNLDIARAVEMMNHLERAAEDLGRTILIVLHDINVAARYADRICTVKDGRILHCGPPDEIMRDEVLTEVFGTPIEVIDGPRGPLACF